MDPCFVPAICVTLPVTALRRIECSYFTTVVAFNSQALVADVWRNSTCETTRVMVKKNCDIMWEQKSSTPLSIMLEFLPVEL